MKGNNVLFYKMTNIVDSSAIKFKNETLISVEATILEKTFSKSLPSFGLLYPKVSGFNTPGNNICVYVNCLRYNLHIVCFRFKNAWIKIAFK